MEAEYLAAVDALFEAIHLEWLKQSIDGSSGVISMKTDSIGALRYIQYPVIEDLHKHIDVTHNRIRERETFMCGSQ